jgi:hypothetical protein
MYWNNVFLNEFCLSCPCRKEAHSCFTVTYLANLGQRVCDDLQ